MYTRCDANPTIYNTVYEYIRDTVYYLRQIINSRCVCETLIYYICQIIIFASIASEEKLTSFDHFYFIAIMFWEIISFAPNSDGCTLNNISISHD